MFCRSLFVLLYFFFWPLCYLFFFDIRILIVPLVSSFSWNTSAAKNNQLTILNVNNYFLISIFSFFLRMSEILLLCIVTFSSWKKLFLFSLYLLLSKILPGYFLYKHTYKTKDRVPQTQLISGGELRCSGRLSVSAPLVTPVSVKRHEHHLTWQWVLDIVTMCYLSWLYSSLFCTLDRLEE
jgi:hypothetical protein